MDLVFVRHGKAELLTEDAQLDAGRKLTPAGIRKLKKTLPALRCLMPGLQQARIWTSPKLRAVQTAEVLAEIYDIDEIRQVDCLGNGDFFELIRELNKTDDHDLILAVGHEPFLSEWTGHLAQTELPYKKGAAACLQIDQAAKADAKLVWFCQPAALKRLTRLGGQ